MVKEQRRSSVTGQWLGDGHIQQSETVLLTGVLDKKEGGAGRRQDVWRSSSLAQAS